jgi:NAD+ synthase (glutamine-hydrolysing)
MSQITVATAALNQTPLDWEGNRQRIIQAIHSARSAGAQFLCLPELAVTGYGCEDMFLSDHLYSRAFEIVNSLRAETRGIMLNLGIPFIIGGKRYNCAAIVCDGQLLGIVAKKHLDNSGVHYEQRWFSEWPVGKQHSVSIAGMSMPAGDVIFSLHGIKIAYEICHDAWVDNRHACDLIGRGVQLIANPSASHFAFGKRAVVEELVQRGSALCDGVYIYSNLLGCESGRTIYGGDRLIADRGKIVASGERFTYRDMELTTATVTIPPPNTATKTALGAVARPVVAPELPTSPTTITPNNLTVPDWESPAQIQLRGTSIPIQKLEEFTRSVSLGLFDYMRKCKAHGFTLSLSGGVDSSATACLVSMMLKFARRDLGDAGVCQKLPHIPALPDALTKGRAMQLVLACAYQSTKNSSAATRAAARTVAEAVDSTFYELDVAPLVQQYAELIETTVAHHFNWAEDDLILQNIQSRVRSPSIWMLANYRKALLLTTGNRSEAAVGYATMDGDTSGGLSPLGGIDKAFLRCWIEWLATSGPSGIGPLPYLKEVIAVPPTAELRPPEAHQTDEGDLMPYHVLSSIERLALSARLSPLQVWDAACNELGNDFSKQQLGIWVSNFFKLWSSNQWKRERFAPSFHIDSYNIDPKTWCRFPILSGGFEAELKDLSAALRALD